MKGRFCEGRCRLQVTGREVGRGKGVGRPSTGVRSSGRRKVAEVTTDEVPLPQALVAMALLLAPERAEAALGPGRRTSTDLTETGSCPLWRGTHLGEQM